MERLAWIQAKKTRCEQVGIQWGLELVDVIGVIEIYCTCTVHIRSQHWVEGGDLLQHKTPPPPPLASIVLNLIWGLNVHSVGTLGLNHA